MIRQACRKSIGGKAPRKGLKTRGQQGMDTVLSMDHDLDMEELAERLKNVVKLKEKFSSSIMMEGHNDEQLLVEYINTKYGPVDDLVKYWIYMDLKKKRMPSSLNDILTRNSQAVLIHDLKKLSLDLKYEILSFLPTYSRRSTFDPPCDGNVKDSFIDLEFKIDEPIVTYHKLRSINKEMNRRMVRRLLTLKHLRICRPLKKQHWPKLIQLLQLQHSQQDHIINNRPIDLIYLYESNDGNSSNVTNIWDSGFYPGATYNSFQHMNTHSNWRSQSVNGNVGSVCEEVKGKSVENIFTRIDQENLEQELLERYQQNRSNHTNGVNDTTSFSETGLHTFPLKDITEEKNLYSEALCEHKEVLDYNYGYPNIETFENHTIERISIYVDNVDSCTLLNSLVSSCKILKSLDMLLTTDVVFNYNLNLQSDSLEYIRILNSSMEYNSMYWTSFISSILNPQLLPNLKQLSFEPLAQLDATTTTFPVFHMFHTANVNVKRKKGSEITLVQNLVAGHGHDLDVLIILACDLTLQDVKELVDLFGADLLYECQIIHQLIYNESQDMLKAKAIAEHIFGHLLTPLNLSSIFLMTSPKSHALLQYLIYIGEEYQSGMLMNAQKHMDVIRSNTILTAAIYGWNISTQLRHFLPLAILTTNAPSIIVSTLKYFHVDEQDIESLVVNCCYQSKIEVLNDLVYYLSKRKRDLLYRLLVKKIKRSAPSNKEFVVTVPIMTLLLDNNCNSYLMVKIIENMDQQLFDSIGANERGDTILHLYLLLSSKTDYNVLFALIKKAPGLVNHVNCHLQTPLHLCLFDCHSFVFGELAKLGNVESKDYMERSATHIAMESTHNIGRQFVDDLKKGHKSRH
ncbi:hypothetical protein C9374_009005 [Naegleria lovaniensis]|uniref:Uncharacterized protein n=1 Tax=Naegleria lovaniensis TaxID=51637 RepID=A0AA88KFM5_NAELO|nr:uncharacterized protein C9374_009005 [Naegleria lovaniensis]KAG2377920.1 hypothetical protein C9374_009005 [Naegleria lovaniensis]